MNSKCHNGFSISIPLLLFLIIILLITSVMRGATQESLTDYGDADNSLNGPLAYNKIMKDIKFPNRFYPIYNLDDLSYNANIFNRLDLEQYSESSIKQDLKYFNNATNLMLDNYFADNRIATSERQHDYLYNNNIAESEAVYNYDHNVTEELTSSEIYDELLNYDGTILPGLNTSSNSYSSYYFNANLPEISDSVHKDFQYFNSTASILSGKRLFDR